MHVTRSAHVSPSNGALAEPQATETGSPAADRLCENSQSLAGGSSARVVAPIWRLVQRNVNAITVLNGIGNGLPFFCVHSVTGEVTSYCGLAALLGPEHPFYGIQVPKERMHANFAASIKTIAQQHAEALVAFQPEGPVVLGGWSSGAIIALEMAQQLRARGRDVPLIVALDGAPCNTGGCISPWHPLYVLKLACNLPGWFRGKGTLVQVWSWRTFVQRLWSTLVFQFRIKGSRLRNEQTLEGDAVQTILDSTGWSKHQASFICALYNASRAYVPVFYPGRVLVFEAEIQPLNHLRQIAAAWKAIAASVEIVRLQSNHLGIVDEPSVRIVAEHLRARLIELRQG